MSKRGAKLAPPFSTRHPHPVHPLAAAEPRPPPLFAALFSLGLLGRLRRRGLCRAGKTNRVAARRCARAGRGGAAGNKFRVGVGMPTSGVMNCADNSGKLPLRAWASGQGGPKGMLRPGAGGARRCGLP